MLGLVDQVVENESNTAPFKWKASEELIKLISGSEFFA